MNLIEASKTEFGNLSILLHSLSDGSCYCIEWFSKMTGATISLARVDTGEYVVIRKWANALHLNDVSTEFNRANQAVIHFLNNVDIAKSTDERIVAAKKHCINLFVKAEGLKPIANPSLPKPRLQDSIGKKVVVKSTLGNCKIVTGVLLQLVGNQVEIQVTPEYSNDQQLRQKFYTKQVYSC